MSCLVYFGLNQSKHAKKIQHSTDLDRNCGRENGRVFKTDICRQSLTEVAGMQSTGGIALKASKNTSC